jgi:hypothetical protein
VCVAVEVFILLGDFDEYFCYCMSVLSYDVGFNPSTERHYRRLIYYLYIITYIYILIYYTYILHIIFFSLMMVVRPKHVAMYI